MTREQLTNGLIICEPWIDFILDGRKTWEMRSRATHQRGPIALVRKGSGTVVGVANIVESLPPLTAETYGRTVAWHAIPFDQQADAIAGGWIYPWVLAEIVRLSRPVPYRHKSGAVITVSLETDEIGAVLAAMPDQPPHGDLRPWEASALATPLTGSTAPRIASAERPNTSAASRDRIAIWSIAWV